MLGDYLKGDLVSHETFGFGRVEDTLGNGETQKAFVAFARTGKTAWLGKGAINRLTPAETAGYELVRLALRELQEEETPKVELGAKWQGGQMIIKPADEALSSTVVPIEAFFHKIVMVRDRLRVMEQQINANKKLNDDEKVDLQQYITRIYGSLTTFNLLFKNRADWFVGQKGEK